MEKGYIIAIDGPVASGKGTIAPKLAEKINGVNLYTGGTYRSVALFCLENGIDPSNEEKVLQNLSSINVKLKGNSVFLNGEEVTDKIAGPEVASATSKISTIQGVREAMVEIQRKLATKETDKGKVVVAEGRDTATRVFPEAKVKIYLTAGVEVRAKRRLLQYEEKGMDIGFSQVLQDTIERDKIDSERKIDPLVMHPEKFGYLIVDNTDQTEDQTVELIVNELKRIEKNYD